MRKYRYRIDKDGGFWHEGTEVRDANVISFFLRGLKRTEDGRLVVMCAGEENEVLADDVPYVVRMIEFTEDGVTLLFAGNFREALDPETLRVGEENVLYVKVRKGAFDARFTRPAYMKLSEKIAETSKGYVLKLGKKAYPIAGRTTP